MSASLSRPIDNPAQEPFPDSIAALGGFHPHGEEPCLGCLVLGEPPRRHTDQGRIILCDDHNLVHALGASTSSLSPRVVQLCRSLRKLNTERVWRILQRLQSEFAEGRPFRRSQSANLHSIDSR